MFNVYITWPERCIEISVKSLGKRTKFLTSYVLIYDIFETLF